MQRSLPDRPRLVGLAAIAMVIAIPVALIAATWEPLESPPHQVRDSAVERESVANGEGTPETEGDHLRPRERRALGSPAAPTPPLAAATPAS